VGDAFTDSRSSLSAQTLYYAAAYATNVGGTSLGAVSTFRTLSNPPIAAATNLTATPASGEQINLSWTAASYPATGATSKGYVLLRATSPNLPTLGNTNGAAPTAGANTSIVSFTLNGTATSASSTGLTGNTSYNYALVPYTWDVTNASTYNYLTTDIASASGTTISSTPSTQPSNLRFTNATCNGMKVTWDNAIPSVSGYLVLQTSGATAPNMAPTSTNAYTVGSTIGNAKVAYVGSDTSFFSIIPY